MPGNKKNECLNNNIKTPLPFFLPGIDEGKPLMEAAEGKLFELTCGSKG